MKTKLYHYKAKVNRVIDGDTIDVEIDVGFNFWLHNVKVRFARINAPETKGQSKEFGLVTKTYVTSLIEHETVILHVLKTDDKYGRILADVYYHNVETDTWINLNQELVEKNLAIPFMTEI